jgi:flagellar hook-length control protein FliK
VAEDARIPEKQIQPSATLNDPSRVVQSRQTSPYLLAPADHAASSVLIANSGEGVSSDLDLEMAVDFTSGRRLAGQAVSAPQALASPTTMHAPVVGATAQVIAAIKANRRSDTIEIRLDPPELGRVKIDFTMETMDSVKAILSAERAETLDHMRRNIGELAAQLKDAGFKSVEFEFAQNSGHEFSNTNAAPETLGKDGDDAPSLGQEDIVYLSMRSDAQLDLLA